MRLLPKSSLKDLRAGVFRTYTPASIQMPMCMYSCRCPLQLHLHICTYKTVGVFYNCMCTPVFISCLYVFHEVVEMLLIIL